MKRHRHSFPVLLFSSVLVFAACAPARSNVRLSVSSGGSISLRALDAAAKKGVLEGAGRAAWFASDTPLEGFSAIEIQCKIEAGGPVAVSVGLVRADDLSGFGALSGNPAARDVSTVTGIVPGSDGAAFCTVRMALPVPEQYPGGADSPFPAVRGFVVSLSGADDARLSLLSAVAVSVPSSVSGLSRTGISRTGLADETGWEWNSGGFWAGFPASGGLLDASRLAAGDIPPVSVPEGSVLKVAIDARTLPIGTQARQQRVSFSADGKRFAFRVPPSPYEARIPHEFLAGTGAAGPVSVLSGAQFVCGMRVSPEDRNLLVRADPHMIVEWPQSAWRRSDYEVFSWDRFPTVLIFDTADYAVQDRLFKRLAFFVEKQGYRGKLWTDADLAGLHAFNAHDYRAESLAEFFARARAEKFPLNRDELELEALLVAEGVIRLEGDTVVPGAGAVISLSRESARYLRYLFMTHEAWHGIYFITPFFRDKVQSVRSSLDVRGIAFLESYFTVIETLGYDTLDTYLMENEFMAYLMQQSVANVGSYFTGQLLDRFRRAKGDPELAAWLQESRGADFVRAAGELNDFAFENWGLAAGRTGLFTFE